MPRFVILEHHWNGVHWDLMLEVDDRLRTWALDAPIAPGMDVPARRLPDHRAVYLDYEGAISGGRGSAGGDGLQGGGAELAQDVEAAARELARDRQ